MDVKFIKSGNPKGGASPRIDLPTGPYSSLLLVVDGDADTGQDLTPDDIASEGDIRVKRFGEQIHGANSEFYYDLSDLRNGHPTNIGGSGDPSRVAIQIPFFLTNIPNVMDVTAKNEADLEIDFNSGLDTVFGANSATYEVYGLMMPGQAELYTLKVTEYNEQVSSSTRINDAFSARNVGEIFLRDPSSVVDALQIKIDNDVVVDNLDDAVLQDVTNLSDKVETSGMTLRHVHQPSTKDLRETLNENVEYSVQFSGGGTAEFTLLSTRFNEARTERSVQRARTFRERRQQDLASRTSIPQSAVG